MSTEALHRYTSDEVSTCRTQAVLVSKILDRSAVIGVVGLGYVGLPFALEKLKVGYRVIGIDRSFHRIEKLKRCESYIVDVPSLELSPFVQSRQLVVTTDYEHTPEIDVMVIAVPTPLSRNFTPDLQYVEAVTRDIAKHIRSGQLICLESTTYPGTTEEVMLPILEFSGLKVEEDFYLAHSPERVDPGNKRYTTKSTSKIVGAVGPKSLAVAETFYAQTIEHVVTVSNAKVAEMAKVFENTFRAVNIALVNEMAMLCDRMDLSVWEVLDAAFTKPFGIMPFYPSPGVGGHCIPIDPHYLEWKAKEHNFHTRFIALAGEINRGMPSFVKDKVLRILNHMGIAPSCSRVLVLGVAYKRDVDDIRESPAISVIQLLKREGAKMSYHDPYVPVLHEGGLVMNSMPLTPDVIREHHLVVITTDHTNVDYAWAVHHAHAVLDTRNATKHVTNGRKKITLL